MSQVSPRQHLARRFVARILPHRVAAILDETVEIKHGVTPPVRRDCFVAPLLAMTFLASVIASKAKQSRAVWLFGRARPRRRVRLVAPLMKIVGAVEFEDEIAVHGRLVARRVVG